MQAWEVLTRQIPACACVRALLPAPPVSRPHGKECWRITAARLKPPLPGGGWWEAPLQSVSIEVASNSQWKCKSLSFFLCFPHRFRILWDEEVERVGPEKASLGRVVWKFQRTRVLMDIVANILCIVMAAVGPVSGAGPLSALSPRSPD